MKKEKYELAIKMYNLSNTFIANCQNVASDEVFPIRIAIFLNIALAYQKLDDQFEARKAVRILLIDIVQNSNYNYIILIL